MRKLRVSFLALILAMAASGATTTVFAEGPTETPGVISPAPPNDGSTSGITDAASESGGPTETPGLWVTLINILTDVI